jgi:hypothetical protein
VLGHLPERDRELVKRRLRKAWKARDDDTRSLSPPRSPPSSGAPIPVPPPRSGRDGGDAHCHLPTREGPAEEDAREHGPVRVDDRVRAPLIADVKRWQNDEMCLRRTAAGLLEAEQQFRRVVGHKRTSRRSRSQSSAAGPLLCWTGFQLSAEPPNGWSVLAVGGVPACGLCQTCGVAPDPSSGSPA